MISKLTWIYIFGFMMLYTANKNTKPISYTKLKNQDFNHYTSYEKKLLTKFDSPENGHLLLAFVKGKSKKIQPQLKRVFSHLNLYHLFTPSGLHLSSIYILIRPILNRFGQNNFLRIFIEIFIAFLPIGLASYYSLKRIAMMRIIALFGKQYQLKISLFSIYLIVFLIDYKWGTYSYSALSYAYSFIFLGIILSSENPLKTGLPYALLGGQIITSFYGQTPLLYTGFISSFIVTAAFTLIFPMLIIYYLTFTFIPINWIQYPINLYVWIINFLYNISNITGFFYSSIPLILIVFIFSLNKKFHLRYLIPLLLLIHSSPAQNLPSPRLKKQEINLKSFLYKPQKVSL